MDDDTVEREGPRHSRRDRLQRLVRHDFPRRRRHRTVRDAPRPANSGHRLGFGHEPLELRISPEHAVHARYEPGNQWVAEVETDRRFPQPGVQKCLTDAIHHRNQRLFLTRGECGEESNAHRSTIILRTSANTWRYAAGNTIHCSFTMISDTPEECHI